MSGQRRASADEVRALSHPLRLRILALCHGEPLSNKELAGRLHEKPATVLHHVRTLVRTGFLEPQEPLPGPRGSTVRPYRATDKSWTIDVGGPTETQSTKRAALDAAFAEMRAVPGPDLGPLLRSPSAPRGNGWRSWSSSSPTSWTPPTPRRPTATSRSGTSS